MPKEKPKKEEIIEGEVIEDKIVVKKEEDKAIVPSAQNLLLLSDALHQSGMFPNVRSKFGALAIIEYGRELGLQPVIALQTMSVISGKICIEAKAMLAMAQKNGVKHEIIEKTKEGSRVQFTKPGSDPYTETFSIDDAEKLGFLKKDNWKMYPEEMCFWRCIAKGLRAYAPDAILGLYSREEMLDIGKSFNSKPEEKPKKKPESKTDKVKEEDKTKNIALEKETFIKEIQKDFKIRYGNNYDEEYRGFKEFLSEHQKEKKRNFVGKNEQGYWSLNRGKLEDLKLLALHLGFACKTYAEFKAKKKEKEEEDEVPF